MLSIIQAAGWPIWPLIACSILALALVFERFVALKTARVAPPALLGEAISVSSRGLPSQEVVQQLSQNSTLGEVLASGLRALQAHPDSSEEELRAAAGLVADASLHFLEGADHGFSVLKSSGRVRADVWEEAGVALLEALASIQP